MSAGQARQLLGLPPGADGEALGRAYRAAAKSWHPDRKGGDAERFRQVVEAHKLLTALGKSRVGMMPVRRPGTRRPGPQRLRLQISVAEALFGGERRVDAGGRAVDVKLPAGLRIGETLRLAGAGPDGQNILLQIGAEMTPGVWLRGHDLWLDLPTAADRLRQGERLEVDTPRGRRAFAIPRALPGGALVRLKGEGLPARGRHPAGDLIIRLTLGSTAQESAAAQKLKSFSARWAA